MEEFKREFIFDSFDAAMFVHKRLFELLRNTGIVSYADVYFMTYRNIVADKRMYKYGWTNLFYSKVEPYENDKWVLKLPELENIEIENNIKKENE